MKLAAVNRTFFGATLALGVLLAVALLASHELGTAAGALAVLSSGLVALVIHRESVGRHRAEAALRRASGELEHRVAQRTAELNTVNVALYAEVLERQRVEDELRRAHEELELRVAERTRELANANRDLIRTNREIQNFYHTLSHELKTPLTAAREFIAIVRDGLAGSVNANQAEYLKIALDSCNQIRVCMNDLLDAARLETGKLSIDSQPAALDEVVRRAVATLAATATERGITLECSAAADLDAVPLDAARITQVVTNLVNNALKFTAPGGTVRVRIEPDPGHPDFLQVSVHDTGHGIPGHELERIFDRLYQVKSGDAASEAGIGLGLYLCRELVRLHGGDIGVTSTVGQGSTFTFTLPKVPAPKPRWTASAPESSRPRRRSSMRPRPEDALVCAVCAD